LDLVGTLLPASAQDAFTVTVQSHVRLTQEVEARGPELDDVVVSVGDAQPRTLWRCLA
jgi:hypothetical protein